MFRLITIQFIILLSSVYLFAHGTMCSLVSTDSSILEKKIGAAFLARDYQALQKFADEKIKLEGADQLRISSRHGLLSFSVRSFDVELTTFALLFGANPDATIENDFSAFDINAQLIASLHDVLTLYPHRALTIQIKLAKAEKIRDLLNQFRTL